MLAQVQHMYHPEMVLVYPCPLIWLADLLTNEEIACTTIGRIVSGTLEDYLEFVKAYL